VCSPLHGALARRLIDAGIADPRPPRIGPAYSVTVVIPCLDRPELLEACLSSTGAGGPVMVVDDGSADPEAVARVCERHGARLVRRSVTGGPAAARNAALDLVDTDLVAFLDSDCIAPAGWIESLLPHFLDPLVGAAAPRIIARVERGARRSITGRFAAAASPLDLGDRPASVTPQSRVAYVPTAALIVRREAMPGAFDSTLRFGEDVDLVWRLVERGWRVRYDPTVRVEHAEPSSFDRFLVRRYRYGTSAGPLARRHPGRLVPLVATPWPSLIVGLCLIRRPKAAIGAFAVATLLLARNLRRAGAPAALAPKLLGRAVGGTFLGAGKAGTQLALPVILVAAGRPGWLRAVGSSLLLGPAALEWLRRRPQLDPLRWTVLFIADDIAYGAGVWRGCMRARTLEPLLPTLRIRARPLRPMRTSPAARWGQE
jgi:mycofactocin system glycosyltransferase